MTATKVQILPLRKASPPSSSSASSSESPQEQQEDATNANLSKEKNKRASKPKVRSGCVTCKIRRVKCDETKPECSRCTSTGRKCDGYVIKPRKKRSDAAIVKELSLTPEIGPVELRALGFFHQKTAPSLSSYFDADFWTHLVFQMSYVEPAIRHAMIALGALHEQREQGFKMMVPIMPTVTELESEDSPSSDLTKTDDRNNRFALAQYNKAIMFLSRRMDSEMAIDVALLACILFVCIEFLQGDAEPAVKHFRSGMTIALATMRNGESRTAAVTLDRIKEHMLPFFNRIELLSTLFGHDLPWNYPVELLEAVPDEFHSMREARDSIVHLCNLSIRFIRRMKHRKYTRLVLPDDITRQTALLRQLDAWSSTLDKMLVSDTVTDRDLDAAKTLRIHQVVACLWLKRSTIPEESANDESMTQFETAISLAEAIHSIAGTREQRAALNSSTFLFDMEIISPLYYVAIKCRHPQFRRRAIAVLKTTQRREGLWDSDMAAAIAEREVEIEEVNLSVLDGSELPPEKDRVHNILINSDPGIMPKRHEIVFHMKPKGTDGPWKIWKEQIVLT